MIDTISIEIDAGKRLEEKDFLRVKGEITKIQKAENNQPKFQSEILIDWPDNIKMTGAYLPDVRYLNYPNRNPNSGGRYSAYRITASLPKLLYGNNIFELSNDNFDKLAILLQSKIVFLGLPTDISIRDIKQAIVRRIDFGKNILLPESSSVRQLEKILANSEHKINSNFAQVQYRNGELYREYIQRRAIIVYDKLSEFLKNKANRQSDFAKFLASVRRANLFQIVRFEVQIQSTKQLKAELKSLKRDQELVSFEDVFDERLARQVLLKYWNEITQKAKITEIQGGELLNIFATAAGAGKNRCGPQKAYAKVGFSALEDEIGANEVKRAFYQYYGGNNWAAYRDSLKSNRADSVCSVVADISKAIEEMSPIGGWRGLNECF